MSLKMQIIHYNKLHAERKTEDAKLFMRTGISKRRVLRIG